MFQIAAATQTPFTSTTKEAKKDDELGRTEFLKLFLSQLQAQDPLNPMDSTEFTAQLAQFSSLEQMFNMSQSMDSLLATQKAQNGLYASSLIGRSVTAEGDSISILPNRLGAEMSYVLSADAADIRVSINNDKGVPVTVLQAPAGAAGTQSLWWDGLGLNGRPVQPGTYTFSVEAFDRAGQPVDAQTLASGTVNRIRIEDGSPMLEVNGRLLPMSAIVQIEDLK